MSDSNKKKDLLIFNAIFIFILVFSIIHLKGTGKEPQENFYIKEFRDSISAKNLKALSEFADTVLITRYSKEIKLFEKNDSAYPNRKVDVIFTGSSSIRKWKTLKTDFNGLNVLNRGFGGSTLPEIIYYSDVLIFKHRPKKIVVYAGENDLFSTGGNSLKVLKSFEYFQRLVKQELPNAQVYFISIKPSPARWKQQSKIQSINLQFKNYCCKTDNCHFIDVSKAMLDSTGVVRKDIFMPDITHLNEKGYKIWAKVIRKALEGKIDKGL